MRATVVVNRCARNLAHEGPLTRELTRPREGVRVVETSSLDELDAAAREAVARSRSERPYAVVLAGGDGSYMAGVTALVRALEARGRTARELPPIALAPGGTVSTVARNWGLEGDRAAHAKRLLDAVVRGAVTATLRPTLRVRDMQSTRIGFIFGAGLVARFFEVYEAEGARGYGGAASIVARIFAGSFAGGALARRVLEPVPMTIEVDGERAPFDRASLVAASVVRDLGLHMHLLHRAAEAMDRFHVVATPLGPARLGPQMPLVLAGRPLLGPRVDALAASLAIAFPSPDGGAPSAGRGADGAYVLDGELLRTDRVRVEPGPVLTILSARA
jgi:diacylglycerol kinase family enzyme